MSDENSNPEETTGTENTGTNTPDAPVAAAEKIVYPIIKTTEEPDGSTMVSKEFEDGSNNYVKTWPDGTTEDNKDIAPMGAGRFVVTRKKSGEMSYVAPSGMKVEIGVSDGEDVLRARRNVGNGTGTFAEESFKVALMSTMCKINGKRIPYEIYPKQFSGLEFLCHIGYFAEKNF